MARMTRVRRAGLRGSVAALLLALLPLAGEAQLVTGLLGASGSAVGPDGALYVTEGLVGRISRVDPQTGEVTTFAEGLPPSLIGIGGAIDVAFIGHTAYALVTVVGLPFGANIDGIYRVDGPASFTVIADLGTFSAAHPPATPFDLPNGLQYALEPYQGGFLVTDGHHNRILRVTRGGDVEEFVTFDNIVPTGLEIDGHRVLMAQAGPAPHAPETGKVISIDMHSGIREIASGAPLLVDVERGRGRTLFALSQGTWNGAFPGSPADPFTGSLLRVQTDGELAVVEAGISLPTSLEIIGNTAYVVTLAGEIWRYDEIAAPPFGR